ncbi:MAG: hypothetical protein GQ477_02400 [Nanohaloarchaea archaeon]|nr:hypothetical protein [Candidatus Nanohaloarchaea archaeon]
MHNNTFSTELLKIIMTTDSFSFDIDKHIKNIRGLCATYLEQDRTAKSLDKLNDTEVKAILRFVEKPHGRHHIAELEKMLKEYDSASVLKIFMKHFYEHEGHKLIHTDILKDML